MITRFLYYSGIRGLVLFLFSFNFNNFSIIYNFDNSIIRYRNSKEQRIPIHNTSYVEISLEFTLEKIYQSKLLHFKDYLNLLALFPVISEIMTLSANALINSDYLLVNENIENFFELRRRNMLIFYNIFTQEFGTLDIQSIDIQNKKITLTQPLSNNLYKNEILISPAIPFVISDFSLDEINVDTLRLRLQGREFLLQSELYT